MCAGTGIMMSLTCFRELIRITEFPSGLNRLDIYHLSGVQGWNSCHCTVATVKLSVQDFPAVVY